MSVQLWSRRLEDLHLEVIEGSVVVYDLRSDQVVCLDERAATVFDACRGLSADEVAHRSGLELDVVEDHLAVLVEHGLVEGSGIARRGFIRSTALAGVAAVGVWSVTAPLPSAAASVGGNSGNN